MERKVFIKSLLLSIAGSTLLSNMANAENILPTSEDGQKRWMDILEYARWCPSPHNTQPWKVKIISDTEAHILYEPQRLVPEEDPMSAFMIIGMTMFCECIKIASVPYGLKSEIIYAEEQKLNSDATDLQLFSIIKFTHDKVAIEIDRELIKKRKTSRLHYQGKAIDSAVVAELQEIVSNHGNKLTATNEKEMIEWVLDLNGFTLFSDMDDDKVRKEIGKWVRTTDDEAHKTNDGLWHHCMRFPGALMNNFFFHHERFAGKRIRKVLAKVYRNSMKGTKTIAWIDGGFSTKDDFIKCGKSLLYMWLCMTKHNIFLHPFGSVITNVEANKKLKDKISSPKQTKLWLLMRLGYSDEPPRSLRRPLTEIVINA